MVLTYVDGNGQPMFLVEILHLESRDGAADIVYMHFSKGFDKTLCDRHAWKVRPHGIQDKLFNWIQNLPARRCKRIVVGGLFF